MVNGEYHQRGNCILKNIISHISKHPRKISIKDLVVLLVWFGFFWEMGLFVCLVLWRIFLVDSLLVCFVFRFFPPCRPWKKGCYKKGFPKDGAVDSPRAFSIGDNNFGEPNARFKEQRLLNCFEIYFLLNQMIVEDCASFTWTCGTIPQPYRKRTGVF